MKEFLNKSFDKFGKAVQTVPEKVETAFREEFNNLKDVMDNSNSWTEKLYAGVTFLDPQAWAEKHPEAAKPAAVAALGAIGVVCPATLPIATIVGLLPEDVCARLLDFGNRPCPPYLVRQILKKKMKEIPEAEKVIVFDEEVGSGCDGADAGSRCGAMEISSGHGEIELVSDCETMEFGAAV